MGKCQKKKKNVPETILESARVQSTFGPVKRAREEKKEQITRCVPMQSACWVLFFFPSSHSPCQN